MQSLETLKSKGQEGLNRLVDLGKSQPEEVQMWGVIGGAAIVGAVAVTAVAKGVVSVFATIASPPVALAIGAVTGGFLGWSFVQKNQMGNEASAEAVPVHAKSEVA